MIKKRKLDVYVIETNLGLVGPFKLPSAAVEWALREIPLAGWKIVRVRQPE